LFVNDFNDLAKTPANLLKTNDSKRLHLSPKDLIVIVRATKKGQHQT